MRYVQSSSNEYLVTGRRGRLRNLGVGASALIWPGTAWVRLPAGKQEATFAMTQETRDGIPLRFKGAAIHRVVEPVEAAVAFDFAGGRGLEQVSELIEHICLAELRDRVSHMTMDACIEERKTTLSQSVEAALADVRQRATADGSGWGIAVDVVQVSQVFVVDETLRQQLEAERRGEIELRSARAGLQTREEIERAELASERRIEHEKLERDRERNRSARASVALEGELAGDRQASDAALARARIDLENQAFALEHEVAASRQAGQADLERARLVQRQQAIELALPLLRKEVGLRRLEVERDVMEERARADLERELLPIRQVPEIAQALSQIYQGATLTVYGADHALAQAFGPLVEGLARRVQGGGECDVD